MPPSRLSGSGVDTDQERLLSVDGAELAVTEYGSGPKVIVSAQQGFTPGGYLEALAQPPIDCHVFAIRLRPLRKQDESPGEDENPRWYARWSNDVYRVTQMLGLRDFVYTGVSHGGVIGWHLAIEHPELLRGLVSIVGVPPPRSRRGGTLSGRASQMGARQDVVALRANVEKLFGPTRDAERLARREVLIQERIERILRTPPDEATVKLGIGFPDVATDEELGALLGQVGLPSLIIGGMHDPWVTPENLLATARSVPGSKLVIFEDESHLIALESHAKIVEEFKLFLDRIQ
jgi:pimeloyl-ACP methyl ester carboxylesterase